MSVTISKVAFNRIPAIARALSSDGDRIVQKVATDVQAEVLDQMSGPKSGRRYGSHRASAPGQAPARDTGNLAGGASVTRGFNRAVVALNAKYAPHLEYGTVKMAPRPVLRPAARKFQGIFNMAVQAMVNRAMGSK